MRISNNEQGILNVEVETSLDSLDSHCWNAKFKIRRSNAKVKKDFLHEELMRISNNEQGILNVEVETSLDSLDSHRWNAKFKIKRSNA
jgi:hypothetical protein